MTALVLEMQAADDLGSGPIDSEYVYVCTVAHNTTHDSFDNIPSSSANKHLRLDSGAAVLTHNAISR